MVRRGHRVTVLTGLPNYPEGHIRDGYRGWFKKRREWHEGVEIIRVPLIPRGKGRGFELILNYLSFACMASILGPLRCRDDYDVILVFQVSPVTAGIPAMLMKWIRRIPLAFWIQDLWPESLSATGAITHPWPLEVVGVLVNILYRHCDSILVQSKGFFAPVAARGASLRKIHYLPNCAEPFYRPIPKEECSGKSPELPEGFKVMFAGNIGAAQDFPTILAAAERTRRNQDIHWIIFGDGRLRIWAEEEVQRLGLNGNFHFMGSRPAHQIPYYSALCDVLLVSLRREPVFSLTIPSKLQSYLACGRPILASLEGAAAQVVIEAGAGMTCPPEDPEALADAVIQMKDLTMSDCLLMGQKARQYYVEEFELASIADRLEARLKELSHH
jgi:colanic acid biosynthesis glycosyl transferase WcaI